MASSRYRVSWFYQYLEHACMLKLYLHTYVEMNLLSTPMNTSMNIPMNIISMLKFKVKNWRDFRVTVPTFTDIWGTLVGHRAYTINSYFYNKNSVQLIELIEKEIRIDTYRRICIENFFNCIKMFNLIQVLLTIIETTYIFQIPLCTEREE